MELYCRILKIRPVRVEYKIDTRTAESMHRGNRTYTSLKSSEKGEFVQI